MTIKGIFAALTAASLAAPVAAATPDDQIGNVVCTIMSAAAISGIHAHIDGYDRSTVDMIIRSKIAEYSLRIGADHDITAVIMNTADDIVDVATVVPPAAAASVVEALGDYGLAAAMRYECLAGYEGED